MPPRLGILAGAGELPRRLVTLCRAAGQQVFVVAFQGHTDRATVDGVPHVWVRLGAAGTTIERLHAEGIRDLVMAGAIRRPSVLELRPDVRAARLFARIGLRGLGDDGLLRCIADELEQEEGFHLHAPQEIFASLLAPAGPLGQVDADDQARADAARGIAVLSALGPLDVGQAVVVQLGLVLGIEAAEGTDALLDRCAGLRREGLGGVLVKVSKPQQDRRFDVPTVGAATVERAAATGLRGIAVEAGGTLIVDRQAAIAAADRLGLFLIGLDAARSGAA
jgi:DUF1009 family protein